MKELKVPSVGWSSRSIAILIGIIFIGLSILLRDGSSPWRPLTPGAGVATQGKDGGKGAAGDNGVSTPRPDEPGPVIAVAAPPAHPVAGLDAAQVELEFWNAVKGSDAPADFQAYLSKYPQGQFRELARNRIDRLNQASRPSTSAPLLARDFAADAYVCGLNPNGDNFLSLRRGPKSGSAELLRLRSNTGLALLETRGAWLRVRLRDGTLGWVNSEWVCRGTP